MISTFNGCLTKQRKREREKKMKFNFWSRSNVCFNGLIFFVFGFMVILWILQCFMLFFGGLEVLDEANFCVVLINLRLDLIAFGDFFEI